MISFCWKSSVSGTYINCQTIVSKSETSNKNSSIPEFYLNFSNYSKKITPGEFQIFKPGDQYCEKKNFAEFREFSIFGIKLTYKSVLFSISLVVGLIVLPFAKKTAIILFLLYNLAVFFS